MNIYQHVTDRFVVDTTTVERIYRTIPPFSLELSYSPFKNFHLLSGIHSAEDFIIYQDQLGEIHAQVILLKKTLKMKLR